MTVIYGRWCPHHKHKKETILRFPELHANKLINQSLHVVDLNIDRYDMIIGRNLIRSLGIDIHGADMTTGTMPPSLGAAYIPPQTMYLCYCNTMHRSNLKPRELSASSMLNTQTTILKPPQKAPLLLILKKETMAW